MGFFNRLFGKRESASAKQEDVGVNLAFVLLAEARLPQADAIIQAFHAFAAPGENLEMGKVDSEEDASKEIVTLQFSTGESSFVASIPAAVPNGEADHGAQFSLSSYRNNWKLPAHHAHLLVTFHAAPGVPPTVRLSRFTSLLAAVAKASGALAVYWGNAGATHDAEFFTSVATDRDVTPRIILWSGVSVAREKDGRLSFLSLGMKQLGLPDLLLVAGESATGAALTTMYDLLAYVVERGEPVPDGDTIGRTAEERLPVRYVKSPVDSKTKVWRVELP